MVDDTAVHGAVTNPTSVIVWHFIVEIQIELDNRSIIWGYDLRSVRHISFIASINPQFIFLCINHSIVEFIHILVSRLVGASYLDRVSFVLNLTVSSIQIHLTHLLKLNVEAKASRFREPGSGWRRLHLRAAIAATVAAEHVATLATCHSLPRQVQSLREATSCSVRGMRVRSGEDLNIHCAATTRV